MRVFELYSKRKKKTERSGKADVYQYDQIPAPLRVQVCHIWKDAMGKDTFRGNEASARWDLIHDALARELGLVHLSSSRYAKGKMEGVFEFFEKADTDNALDLIELSFRVIERLVSQVDTYSREQQEITITAQEAIDELNFRFREHGVGYQYENGEIVRVDNQYVHAEVTKPALAILAESGFERANEDFMAAHRHYRSGEFKDCVVAAQRAFESILKAICEKRKWSYQKGDRLPELVKLVRGKGLFPDYLDGGMDTYVAMLKTGLPGVRNNAGGHGQAPSDASVPAYIAAYALHMTATNILMAAEASKTKARSR